MWVASLALVTRRDVGGAVRPDRDIGPARGRRLTGLAALEARLAVRGALAWGSGLVALGAVSGMLASGVARFVRDDPSEAAVVERFGIADLGRPEAFVGLMFSLVAVVVLAMCAARTTTAAADSETDGLADHLVVQPVSRIRWLLTHVAVSVATLVGLAVLTGVAAWAAMQLDEGAGSLPRSLGAGLNLVPLAVAVVGLGTLAHGLSPRAVAPFVLSVVGGGYVLELLGVIVGAPNWLRDLSPFHHVAPYPASAIHPVAPVVLSLVGAASIVLGAALVARRDVRSS
jgi:ABC-2 type transport system permease protein